VWRQRDSFQGPRVGLQFERTLPGPGGGIGGGGAGIYIYICLYTIYIYICMYMYVCLYVCMYVCIYICPYVCIYICIHIYIDICIYMYMYVCTRMYTRPPEAGGGHSLGGNPEAPLNSRREALKSPPVLCSSYLKCSLDSKLSSQCTIFLARDHRSLPSRLRVTGLPEAPESHIIM